jgi:hypothetical protein
MPMPQIMYYVFFAFVIICVIEILVRVATGNFDLWGYKTLGITILTWAAVISLVYYANGIRKL